ncbi:hypothetical protein BN14_04607 [Rhizoctonia solani AG-1 IB]|uniref:Phytanoyl-CoA dioxygenase n=1 Tax=Thanatephorus cucumeris (strain AG1-IB / isolate 7/3/14) TaxID=1108050 RepID=M5C3V2_THACB|nr:hypothetical protein BN14_04607 [Rhizoctonia solani AG-1 IB]
MAPVAVDTTPVPELFRVSSAPLNTEFVAQKRPSYAPPNRKLENIKLRSNLGPMDSTSLGWLQPVYANSTSLEEMRERFVEQGYLWVKGLIPREEILDFRRKYFEFMAPTGVLKEGTDPIEGIYCGADPERYLPPGNGREGHNTEKAEQFIQRNIEAHHSKWLEEISSHPTLFKFVKDFTQWPAAKLLKRQMLRANVPGAETTAVHYDHIFLRYGPPTFLTAWLPFGDIPVEGGGLTYLENAVPIAQAIENDFTQRAEKFTLEERLSAFNTNMARGGALSHDSQGFSRAHGNQKWLIADYEAGDVMFHHPFSIHASCVNESPTDTIRLATDLRFVNPEAPYDTRWTNYWYPNDGL